MKGFGFISAVGSVLSLVMITASVPARAATVDAVNAGQELRTGSTWGVYGIGWLYTPTSSYTLGGVYTEFSQSDGRTAFLDIYDSLDMSLLRSRAFNVAPAGSLTGADIAPLNLVGGHTYLVAFENVVGLGTNVALSPSAADLSLMARDFVASGWRGPYSGNDFTTQPILQFTDGVSASSATPLPSAALAGATLLAGVGLKRPRRRVSAGF